MNSEKSWLVFAEKWLFDTIQLSGRMKKKNNGRWEIGEIGNGRRVRPHEI